MVNKRYNTIQYNTIGCIDKHYALFLTEPRPPSVPQNLTEGDTSIHDGKVSISIHWKPPRKSDLPVTRYKVRPPGGKITKL